MAKYISNRNGGKTDEQGHYRFHVNAWDGNILNDGLKVKQNSPLGMSVLIEPGDVKIDYSTYGYTGWNDADEAVTIATADGSNPRIDRIVAYVDRVMTPNPSNSNNPGMLKFMSVAGTPAGSPSPVSDSTVNTAVSSNPWCELAQVQVNSGVSTITNGSITDKRTFATPKIADEAVTPEKLITGTGTSSQPITMLKANSFRDGYLSSTDWNTFDNKIATVTKNAPLSGDGTSSSPLVIPKASSTTDGYLSAADWNTFYNNSSSVATTSPISGDGTTLDPVKISRASTTVSGYLHSTDFSLFSAKLTNVTSDGSLSGNGTSGSPLSVRTSNLNGDGIITVSNGANSVVTASNVNISIAQASSSSSGYLTQADWSSFNSKLSTVTKNSPLTGAGTSSSPLGITQASSTTDGYLSAADWNTFYNATVGAIETSDPIYGDGSTSNPIDIRQASGSQDGYISATDYLKFNKKLDSVYVDPPLKVNGSATNPIDISTGDVLTSGPLTINNGTDRLVGAANMTIVLPKASSTTDGYLSKEDWTAFNSSSSVNVSAPITGAGTSASPFTVQDASDSQSGVVNTTTQTFEGNKTFNGSIGLGKTAISSTKLYIASTNSNDNGIKIGSSSSSDNGVLVFGSTEAANSTSPPRGRSVLVYSSSPGGTIGLPNSENGTMLMVINNSGGDITVGGASNWTLASKTAASFIRYGGQWFHMD